MGSCNKSEEHYDNHALGKYNQLFSYSLSREHLKPVSQLSMNRFNILDLQLYSSQFTAQPSS